MGAKFFEDSELILNPDGSVYHLHLLPEHIAPTVILVGDPSRVATVSQFFDHIEHRSLNREFAIHTGTYNQKRITVISTGIGTDNIDIVVNELDAAVNIDLNRRVTKDQHTSLNIIRLGTTGGLQPFLKVDAMIASALGLGMDGLLNFYNRQQLQFRDDISKAFIEHTGWGVHLPYPYVVEASEELMHKIAYDITGGITATAPGFYGPQGRVLRVPLADDTMNEKMESFDFAGQKITNFEMETSALYGLGQILGHKTLTVCTIIANRSDRTYSTDYKSSVEKMIKTVLERI